MNFLSKLSRRNSDSDPDCAPERGGTGVWVTWYIGSLYAFYVLLAVATLLAQFSGNMTATERITALGLSLLLAVWHYFALHRRSDEIYRNAPAILLYFAGVLVLLALLIYLDPFYNFMAFIIFWQNFSLWGLWFAIPGATLGSVYMMWTNSNFTNPLVLLSSPEAIGFLFVPFVVSVVMALFITSIIRQSNKRQSLIEELESTRAELAKEERRAGTLEERGRLAREIHDTLAQGFISIVTHLEAAEESDPSEAREHIARAKHTSRENLVEARRLVAALRPELLEGSSLPDALKRLSESWSSTSGVPARFGVTGDESPLPQDTQVAVLRTAQEALSNVRRHADAGEVNLTLSYSGDVVLLDVQDDGCGFDPSDCERDGDGGFGLHAMRERVENLGGELSIESAVGRGTTIALSLPTAIMESVQG